MYDMVHNIMSGHHLSLHERNTTGATNYDKLKRQLGIRNRRGPRDTVVSHDK